MNDISTIILRSGLNSLIYENDESFKKSLINSLSFKLNEAVKDAQESFASNMLYSVEETKDSENIKKLVEFFENYNVKTNNKLNLKNHTSINITEEQVTNLKLLFNSLNTKNREILAKELLEDVAGVKRAIDFYERAQRALK
jgi:exoribonuclease R